VSSGSHSPYLGNDCAAKLHADPVTANAVKARQARISVQQGRKSFSGKLDLIHSQDKPAIQEI
jgi:hypothetical protein